MKASLSRHVISVGLGLVMVTTAFGQLPEKNFEVPSDFVATEVQVFEAIRTAKIAEPAEDTVETAEDTVPGPALPVFEKPVTTAKPQNQNYVRPSSKVRFNRYVKSIFGPSALLGNAASAGWGTITNSPEEWEKNTGGFARRFASGFGSGVIKKTTMYGLDEALKFDSHFYKSKNRSTGAKVKNALISPVTAYNKNGNRVIGVPRIVGTYTSAIIARETWYPDRYDYKDGLKSGTISLGMNAAFNLVKEFVF